MPALMRRIGSAFTLVEMLVAVGAVALVSVGLAAIFQTVGKTVTTGKRVSQLTQQAAILESQMREDFARLTRDGFMVIRHQFTIDGNPLAVINATRFKGDAVSPRPRRIDEIIFFATGEYRSTREQMIPGRSAESRAARIYYGHGQRAAPLGPNETDGYYNYYNPGFDDTSMFKGGGGGYSVAANVFQNRLGGKIPTRYADPGVNYYASDWTLLRHATLLQKPGTAPGSGWPENVPRPTNTGDTTVTKTGLDRLAADSMYQIAGQPAAPSIFRSIGGLLKMNNASDNTNKELALFWPSNKQAQGELPPIVPRFESGLVEIATTDLDEISLIVNGSWVDQTAIDGDVIFSERGGTNGQNFFMAPTLKVAGSVFEFSDVPTTSRPLKLTRTPIRRSFGRQLPGTGEMKTGKPLALMQSWMIDAMPSPSGLHPTVSDGFDTTAVNNNPTAVGGRTGARIRYDDKTPDLRGTLDSYTGRSAAIRRTDLLSLGLARVAAHCTEFIVEWSWGQTYPIGTPKDEFGRDVDNQIVWYGRTLQTFSPSGVPDTSAQQDNPCPDVFRYEPGYQNSFLSGKNFRAPPPPEYKPFSGILTQTQHVQDYVVSDALVHGVKKRKANDNSSLISYFGYFDPTFVPVEGTDDPPSMPWPWPKMLRITITLADANDPSIEQTFQYVFDLPPDQKP